MELKELERGKEFELASYKWIVLEQNEEKGSTLVVAKECIEEMAFDEGGSNDFRNSSLRIYLNNDFLEELQEEGLDKSSILLTDFDLTNSNGENIYGLCRDKIGLLTQEQYKEHRDILTLDDWWWLITPHASGSHNVRSVVTGGVLGSSGACRGGSGVRPALNLDSGIAVTVDDETEINGLEMYSTEELLQELLKREKEKTDEN